MPSLGTLIGNKYYTDQQINDPSYQDEIRQAVVGGGAIKNNMGNGIWEQQPNGMNQVQQPTQQPIQKPQQQPQYNLMDMNSQLVAAQKANKLAGLQGAYNSSLSNLNQQDAKIDPQAYKDRGQTSTASQLGAKNFAEYLANRGQTNSGFGNQSELNRNMQLQGDIGSIDLQARNAHNDINTSKTNLSNALNTDIQSANANIDADSLSRQIQLMQQEQARQDQLSQFAQQYGLSLAGLTGNINGQQTLAAQQQQYQNNFNQQQFDYNKSQDLINQTGQLGNGQYTQNGLMNNLSIQQQQAQLAEMQNPNSVTNQMAKLGLQTAQLNFAALPQQLKAQAQQIAQQLAQGAIDLKTAQTQLNYLPRQLQAELNQTYAQTSAANRSNTSNSTDKTTANGVKSTTSLESAINKAITETNTIVNRSGENFDERLNMLNNMLKNYSAAEGNEADYMVNYVTKAIATVTQQKRDFINSGRYAGM